MSTKRCLVLFAAMFACVVSATAHAQLDKKELAAVNRAKGKLKVAEGYVDQAIKMYDNAVEGNYLTPVSIGNIERKLDGAEAQTKAAEELAQPLPQAATEVQEINARVSTIRERSKALYSKVKAESDKLGADDALLEESFDKEQETFKSVTAQLDSFASSLRSPRASKDILESWPQLVKDAERLLSRYGGLKASSGKARSAEVVVQALKTQYENAQQRRDGALKSLPAQIEEQLREAKESAKKAIDNGSFGEFTEYVAPALRDAEAYLEMYEIISVGAKDADPKLGEKTRATIKELNELQKKHEAKIIEANKAPEDRYKGGERASIVSVVTSVVQEANKGQKLLGIKIVEDDWERISGEKWDAQQLAWYKFDESHLRAVALVTSPDGKFAYQYEVMVVKKHLANDKLIVTYYLISGKPESPFRIIPIAKIK